MIDLTGIHVAAVFAHPDDEAFTVGGVLAAFTDRGAKVTFISSTRGEKGEIASPDLATPETLGTVREQELRDAAAILGSSDVRFLDFRDSDMFGRAGNNDPEAFIQHSTDETATKLLGILADVRPDLVITFSEEGGYLHPDHVHTWETVMAARERAPELIPQLYFATFPREFLTQLANQDHGTFEGMSEERRSRMGQPMESFTLIANVEPYLDRKVAAFEAHKTQHPKEGEHPFLDSDEARYQFGSHEYYIHATPDAEIRDPLVELARDLPGSEIR